MLPKSTKGIFSAVICMMFLLAWSALAVSEGQRKSLGCSVGDSGVVAPFPFDVGDGNDYGQRRLELTVPSKCQCDGNNCTPCAIVVGYHGYSETGTSNHSEAQEMFHCFTKDAEGKACRKLAIWLWDGSQRGDDGVARGVGATHERSGREWIGGEDPGTGGSEPMDIMWRFFQWSVGN